MQAEPRAAAGPGVPGIGRRLMSMLYESLLAFAVAFFAALAFRAAAGENFSGLTRHLFQLWLFLVLGIYFVACWRNGQTLPMKTWKMRLVGAGGNPPGMAQALLRYLLAWPSLLAFGAGVLWVLFDRDRQFLHDRLAGTKIVNTGN